jgi:hypothetical protein
MLFLISVSEGLQEPRDTLSAKVAPSSTVVLYHTALGFTTEALLQIPLVGMTGIEPGTS